MFSKYLKGIFILSYFILSFVILDFGLSLMSEPNTLYVYSGFVIHFTWLFATLAFVVKHVVKILKRKGFIK